MIEHVTLHTARDDCDQPGGNRGGGGRVLSGCMITGAVIGTSAARVHTRKRPLPSCLPPIPSQPPPSCKELDAAVLLASWRWKGARISSRSLITELFHVPGERQVFFTPSTSPFFNFFHRLPPLFLSLYATPTTSLPIPTLVPPGDVSYECESPFGPNSSLQAKKLENEVES